jgi:hypothetical protein
MENKQTTDAKPSAPLLTTKLLLWASCVDHRLVLGLPYVATVFRASVIGALVLISASFAFLTSASFLNYFSIGQNLPTIAVFALSLFWALLIFSVERLILLSNTKSKDSDPIIKWLVYILRIVIAIVLGLLLSEPLKLRMFQDDIAKLEVMDRANKSNDFNTRLAAIETSDPRTAEIGRLQSIRNYFSLLRDCEMNNAENQAAGTRQYVDCTEETPRPLALAGVATAPKGLFSDEEKRAAIRKNSAIAIRGPLAQRSTQLGQYWAGQIKEFDADPLRGRRLLTLTQLTQSEMAERRTVFSNSLNKTTPLVAYGYLRKLEQTDEGAYFLSKLVTIGFILVDLIVLVAKLSFGKSLYDSKVELYEDQVRQIDKSVGDFVHKIIKDQFDNPKNIVTDNDDPKEPLYENVSGMINSALRSYTSDLGSAYIEQKFTKLKIIAASVATTAATTAMAITWPAVFLYAEQIFNFLQNWLSSFKAIRDILILFGL